MANPYKLSDGKIVGPSPRGSKDYTRALLQFLQQLADSGISRSELERMLRAFGIGPIGIRNLLARIRFPKPKQEEENDIDVDDPFDEPTPKIEDEQPSPDEDDNDNSYKP